MLQVPLFALPFVKIDVIKTMCFREGGSVLEILLLESDYREISEDQVIVLRDNKCGVARMYLSSFHIKADFPVCINAHAGEQRPDKHLVVNVYCNFKINDPSWDK